MNDVNSYLPAADVLKRYRVCDRTLDRWLQRIDLDFPKPLLINRRRYWRVEELLNWERARASGKPMEVA
jgi:hypothetical protein